MKAGASALASLVTAPAEGTLAACAAPCSPSDSVGKAGAWLLGSEIPALTPGWKQNQW